MQILNHYIYIFFLELFQKSHIRIHEISEIRNSVFDHHKAIESKSKCKSRIHIWIESSLSENCRMYETCTHEFDPTRSFTYFASYSITEWTREIHFDSRLDEREIARAHADLHFFFEYIREHCLDREFQVSHTDSLIYDNSFYLVECIVMCRIDILISKYAPRNDRSDRWSIVSHDEILHARCLSCEDISCSFEPECILHISSRMGFWDIDCIKIEILCRNFHGLINIKSHTTKCVFDILTYKSDRMK